MKYFKPLNVWLLCVIFVGAGVERCSHAVEPQVWQSSPHVHYKLVCGTGERTEREYNTEATVFCDIAGRMSWAFCLCVQLLACVGMISWNFAVKGESFLGHVLSFTLLYSSLYSTYVWPGES